MIIECVNCKTKFNIDGSLIPNKGRLLQCNNCNYKWFFKKKIISELVESTKINAFNIFDQKKIKDDEKTNTKDIIKITTDLELEKTIKKKKY